MVVMLAVEPGDVKKQKNKKKKKRFTYADGWWSTRTDGVRADTLRVVGDTVYWWPLTRMDGGGVGR